MNDRYVLDSWALLALIQAEKPAAGRVEQLLEEAAKGNVFLALSVINLGEFFHILGRRRGEKVPDSSPRR